MKWYSGRPSAGVVVGMLCLGMFAPVRSLSAAGEWLTGEASIRFTIDLTGAPTHASAGYFVTLPDGGILPKPLPQVQVYDAAGKALKTVVLWHNSASGVGVVFESPASGESVTAYVSGAANMNLWTPESGLTPSALICTSPKRGSRADALKLKRLGPVEAAAHFRNQPGSQSATMALPGDRSGRPGTCAMYMLAYVNVTDPGNTWIAPVLNAASNRGSSGNPGELEVLIDGNPIHPSKKSDKLGGMGATVNLSGGLHRMELLGFNPDGGPTGPLLLTWRTPKTTNAELGGIRPSDLRYAGTPMWEARQLRPGEVVRSGSAEVRGAQMKDGGPVAIFTYVPDQIYAFQGEAPYVRYRFGAVTAGNPPDTRYTWAFSGSPGSEANGPKQPWLLKGHDDYWVTLRAVSGEKQSKCSYLLYSFRDTGSSMNDPVTRSAFREACLNMLTSYPAKDDPLAGWDSALWNTLFRSLELVREDPLVDLLVSTRWVEMRKVLLPERANLLEDLFFLETAHRNPERAMKMATELAKNTMPRERLVALKLKQAEILMYYMKDFDGARKLLTGIQYEAGDVGEVAKIRFGDLELLQRNLNEATQHYGDVQNRAKHREPEAGAKKASALTMSGPMKSSEFAKMKAAKQPAAPRKTTSLGMEPPSDASSWKLAAIREVSMSEEVRNLMADGFYLEAFQTLRRWEREFPLSKLSSDYILQEGKFYIWLGDFKRARAILGAYCEQVDASNFVVEAMGLVKECMYSLKEPQSEIDKYSKEIDRRTEFRSVE
jgi:hypothetical protein